MDDDLDLKSKGCHIVQIVRKQATDFFIFHSSNMLLPLISGLTTKALVCYKLVHWLVTVFLSYIPSNVSTFEDYNLFVIMKFTTGIKWIAKTSSVNEAICAFTQPHCEEFANL